MCKEYSLPVDQFRTLKRLALQAQRCDQGEVCGLLIAGTACKLALRFLSNHSARRGHFEIDPAEYGKIRRACRQEGLRVVGSFHSHPISDPTPSPRDLKCSIGKLSLIYDVCGREAKLWFLGPQARRRKAREIQFVLAR